MITDCNFLQCRYFMEMSKSTNEIVTFFIFGNARPARMKLADTHRGRQTHTEADRHAQRQRETHTDTETGNISKNLPKSIIAGGS